MGRGRSSLAQANDVRILTMYMWNDCTIIINRNELMQCKHDRLVRENKMKSVIFVFNVALASQVFHGEYLW